MKCRSRSTVRPSSGSCSSRMRPTTTRRRSSRSAARQPALAARSATRSPGRAYVYQAMRVTGSGDPTVPFEDTLTGKLPTTKDYHRRCGGLFLLRQPDRPCDRSGHGALSSRLCCKAHGDRRGHRRMLRRRTSSASKPEARRYHCPARRTQRAATAAAAQRVPPRHIRSNPSRSAAQRCRRATRRPNAKFSVCSATRRFPRSSSAATTSARAACASPSASLLPGLEIDLNKVPKKYEGLDGTELADFRIAGAYGGRA